MMLFLHALTLAFISALTGKFCVVRRHFTQNAPTIVADYFPRDLHGDGHGQFGGPAEAVEGPFSGI